MEYRLLVDFEVIEIIDGLPSNVRRRIRAQLGKLRSAPELLSDYSEYDRVGRRWKSTFSLATVCTIGLILQTDTSK